MLRYGVQIVKHIVLDVLKVTVLVRMVTRTRHVCDYLISKLVRQIRHCLHPSDQMFA